MHYRLYFRHGAKGSFVRCEAFEAESDQIAEKMAERFAGQHAMELWSGPRHVRDFQAHAAPTHEQSPAVQARRLSLWRSPKN